MPDRHIELRTPRLLLRPSRPTDAARFTEIQSNWNVTRMLRMAAWPVVPAEMAAWVDEHAREWSAGTAYRFAVERDGLVIGLCDLDEIEGPRGDLGYWYDEASWGQGLATEAARAVVRFGLETLGLTRLRSGHAADNAASGRVLIGLGFRPGAETMKFSRPQGREIAHLAYMLEKSGA
ncbi:MAG TPA: GNAT family N-acetyltransferase [Phenylobacterium sp.]|nr:GNAT family N-acetyltransferase [Phenylobacterium sp.]